MATRRSTSKTGSNDIALDDLLVNLQKSLSRVSAKTASVPDDQARSLIYGDVDFAIELQADGEQDRVIVRKDGAFKLSLNGKMSMDIRGEEMDKDGTENG